MADENDGNLNLTLRSFQDSLWRDKLEFEHALHEFLSTKRPQMREYAGSQRPRSGETWSWQPHPAKTDVTTPEMMLDRRRNANNRQFLSSTGQQAMEEVPKYGLPGMGEYEEKQKKYKEQLRDEYRSYMREQNAITTRRRLVNDRDDNRLNYDELLARKREEERNYRNRNDGFANGGMRANSDGYLNKMPVPDQNYGRRPNVDVRPEVEQVTSMMDRIQRYNDELSSRDDEDVQYSYGSHTGASERPHSYPHDTHPTSNFQHNGYSPEQGGHRRSESPKFITMDHPQPRASNEHGGGATSYLNDLDNQVEASRRRRQNEKEEQLRYERKLEEDNKAYDPWGRGGAGAPMRDRDGNVIASRKQMGGERKSRTDHRLPPANFTDANYRKKSDAQDTVANYAIPRSPLPGQSSKYEGRKMNHDTYQEDLKRQIEDKKRRDKEEKEKERLEEERLMRRIEEENEKMKRDHEEEVHKQRLREDERRRRNEELQRRQEEQRKAAEMQKREKKLKRRQEQFEERGVTLARQSSIIDEPKRKSPPVPGRKSKMAVAETHKPTIMANQVTRTSTPTNKQGSSKDHILSQLSVMRQQLEREQQLMQKQLKKEMGNDYEVYDKKAAEAINERNRVPSDDRNKPSIYRPSTPPAQPKPPVKKLPSALKYNLPVYEDFVSDGRAPAPTDTKSAVVPVAKSRTLWPAMAMAIRATDGLKPLQGESLFLGVDGYESTSATIHRQADWHRDGTRHHEASDEYQYDVDQLASHDAARRRYLSTLKDDPDEIKEDSFLDEFLAKNLHQR